MHNSLRVIKVTEKNKPLFIAGILIALQYDYFSTSYRNATSYESLISALNSATDDVLKINEIGKNKIEYVKDAFKVTGYNEKLKVIPLSHNNSLLWYIEQLEMKIKPMMMQQRVH